MSIINVVIDTNVLISALKSKQGASYKLLLALADDLFLPNISVPLFLEYESVAKRAGLLDKLEEKDINSILNYFLAKSSVRKIFYLWRPYLKDSKDDLVLEVAVESRSEYIITFNKKDFVGCNKFGIKIVTPLEFIKARGILG
nr:putative toxin-antitoxin system toxin component, PIN family [Sulfurimonas sp. MAG313]